MTLKHLSKYFSLIAGPLSYFLVLEFFNSDSLSEAGLVTLAVTAWVAIWWITEPIPIAASALLPIILFPLNGNMTLAETTACYGDRFIFLFLGGFGLAIAIEKWQLHKRIALSILYYVGIKPQNIIFGFMVASAFLSMWISNTATAVMIMPVGLAIIRQYQSDGLASESAYHDFGKAVMLAIAYGCSIGGMATLIGTPPNLIMAGVIEKSFGVEISFLQWFMIGFPLSVVLLLITWLYLTKVAFNLKIETNESTRESIKLKKKQLGLFSKEETVVMWVFICTAFAWITKTFLLVKFLPKIDDTIIAMICFVALFILPAQEGKKILEWNDTKNLPWGILILFGGGMALALAFETSGLAEWVGLKLQTLEGISFLLLTIITVGVINFLTEITSNTATTAILLPILIPFAVSIQMNPYYLLVGATMGASCAFMLPAATPPNAIVFASGNLSIQDMIRKGFWINIISIIIISGMVYFLLPIIWGF